MFQNRIGDFYAEPPADKLLSEATSIRLELLRYRGDDDDGGRETCISYEIHGRLAESDAPLLSKLLAQFTPRREGGVA